MKNEKKFEKVSEKQNNVQKQIQNKTQQNKVNFDFDFKVVDVDKNERSKEKKFNWEKIFQKLAEFIVFKETHKIQKNGFELSFEDFSKNFMLHGSFDGKTTINYQLCKYNYADNKSNERVEKNYQKISEIANNIFKQLNMNIKVKITNITVKISRKDKVIKFGIEYEKI